MIRLSLHSIGGGGGRRTHDFWCLRGSGEMNIGTVIVIGVYVGFTSDPLSNSP